MGCQEETFMHKILNRLFNILLFKILKSENLILPGIVLNKDLLHLKVLTGVIHISI